MRLLELFSGTGSVRKAIGHQYDEVISIDILQKFNPTEVADILKWDYKKYPRGYFDAIWASPPCIEYSQLKAISRAPRNLQLADSIVKRTIEIIEYFNPDMWFIENPQTGLLKDREFMFGLPYVDIDYCRYSNWGYRKRTRIWTNVEYIGKSCNKACGNMDGKKHKNATCQGRSKNGYDKSMTSDEMYRIPEKLIQELFSLD